MTTHKMGLIFLILTFFLLTANIYAWAKLAHNNNDLAQIINKEINTLNHLQELKTSLEIKLMMLRPQEKSDFWSQRNKIQDQQVLALFERSLILSTGSQLKTLIFLKESFLSRPPSDEDSLFAIITEVGEQISEQLAAIKVSNSRMAASNQNIQIILIALTLIFLATLFAIGIYHLFQQTKNIDHILQSAPHLQ